MQNTANQRIKTQIGGIFSQEFLPPLLPPESCIIPLYFASGLKAKHRNCLIYGVLMHFVLLSGGERGIRTPGTLQYNGFQDRRDRPLCHLSLNVFWSVYLLKRCKGTILFFSDKHYRQNSSVFFYFSACPLNLATCRQLFRLYIYRLPF